MELKVFFISNIISVDNIVGMFCLKLFNRLVSKLVLKLKLKPGD